MEYYILTTLRVCQPKTNGLAIQFHGRNISNYKRKKLHNLTRLQYELFWFQSSCVKLYLLPQLHSEKLYFLDFILCTFLLCSERFERLLGLRTCYLYGNQFRPVLLWRFSEASSTKTNNCFDFFLSSLMYLRFSPKQIGCFRNNFQLKYYTISILIILHISKIYKK